MKIKRLAAVASVILAVMLMTIGVIGCSDGEKEKVEVKVAMGDYFAHYVLNYAIENDLVTSNKVDVNIRYGYSYGHNEELLEGNCPMGEMSTSVFGTLPEISNISYKAVAMFVTHAGMETEKGVSMVFSAAGSDINSPEDLAGKTIGVTNVQSNTTTVFLGMLNEDYGISEDQVSFVAKPPALLAQLLIQGDLDAIVLGGDPAIANYYNDEFKVVWNLDLAFNEKYGVYTSPSLFVVDSSYLEENRDVAEAVYNLLLESVEYGEAHLDELSQLYADEKGGDAAFYKKIYIDHYSISLTPVDGLAEDAIMTTFGFTKDRGIITELPDPDTCFEEW